MADKKKKDILSKVSSAVSKSRASKRTSSQKTSSSASGKRTSKSKEQQTKELGIFAAVAVAAGAAAAKSAGKGKSKGKKTAIGALAFVLVLAILVSGCMFYMDIAPFNFEINGNMFKYYNYPDVKVNRSMTSIGGSDFRFHMIDVGQGDCLLLELPDGKKMLIDGGDRSNALADGIINDYLLSDTLGLKDSNGIVNLDYVLLTHADADHCGSLDDIISSDKISVKEVYRPMILSKYANDPLKTYATTNDLEYSTITTTVYSNFVQSVAEEPDCVTHYNLGTYTLGGDDLGYIMYFFNPTQDMYKGISSAADKNNVSPIIILDVYGIKICLTGDADKEQELNFVSQLNDSVYSGIDNAYGDVDILKVGHHGGRESSNQEFLDVLKPEYALISVGEGNKYGHPTQEALTRLSATCAQGNIYRTDINGNIVFTVSSTGQIGSFQCGKAEATQANTAKYGAFYIYNAAKLAANYLAN